MSSQPPYGLYELLPEVGKISPHRTDTGAFLLADAYRQLG
jgi:molybdenum storage protein